MISFGQFLLLVFVIFLLFGDVKKILSKISFLFVCFKSSLQQNFKKKAKTKKEDDE